MKKVKFFSTVCHCVPDGLVNFQANEIHTGTLACIPVFKDDEKGYCFFLFIGGSDAYGDYDPFALECGDAFYTLKTGNKLLKSKREVYKKEKYRYDSWIAKRVLSLNMILRSW